MVLFRPQIGDRTPTGRDCSLQFLPRGSLAVFYLPVFPVETNLTFGILLFQSKTDELRKWWKRLLFFPAKVSSKFKGGVEDVSEWPRVLSRVFEGYRLSPQNAQLPPPQKILVILLLSLQYISNYIGKII